MRPNILVTAGSFRSGSVNTKLANVMTREIADAGAEIRQISLGDYPMPIYDGDFESENGPPENAAKLYDLLASSHGVFIANPEYNASITPLVKNTLDWISRVSDDNRPRMAAFTNPVWALGAASPGGMGGMRDIMTLRHVLELGLGALVIPQQVLVGGAMTAFDDNGRLTVERSADAAKTTAKALVDMARHRAGA